jgi:NADPH:quinone reductase-like Zn-dependent oxidoreductase
MELAEQPDSTIVVFSCRVYELHWRVDLEYSSLQVMATSVNPVDYKIRSGNATLPEPKILGYDASGVVEAVGPEVKDFKVGACRGLRMAIGTTGAYTACAGDEVYYSGVWSRPGSDAQYQLADERIVGHKPASLGHDAAAGIPLVGLTAYEALFDRLRISRDGGDAGKSILIIGGGGGVASTAIQLAKLAGLKVIATSSRDETSAWVKKMGADAVVNHKGDMVKQVRLAEHVDPEI